MRSLVFLLIFGNIVVFALSAGWVGGGRADLVVVPDQSHQPLSPDRIRIVSRGEPPQPPANSQCLEWRALSSVQADAIGALAASQKDLVLAREETQAAVSAYRVFIAAPKGGQAAGEKKAAELRKLGIKDFQVGKAPGGDAWAIELGAYDDEATASQALADFRKLGARSAQLEQRLTSAQYRVRARGEPDALAPLRRIPDVGAPQSCPPDAAPATAGESSAAPAAAGALPAAETPVAVAPAAGSAKP